MKRICNCIDFEENMSKMNAGFTMTFVHGMGGYTGKIIIYCPWCGKKLKKEQTNARINGVIKVLEEDGRIITTKTKRNIDITGSEEVTKDA